MKTHSVQQNEQERQRYAIILDRFARLGLVLLLGSFLAYVAGFFPGKMDITVLAQYWHLPLDRFLQATGSPVGWGWLKLITYGDFACLLGIALLAGSSIPCLLAVIPLYARRRDHFYLLICLLQIGVLCMAAFDLLPALR